MDGQDGVPEEIVEVYSSVMCTLRPEVVDAIQSEHDVIRRAIEAITGVTFDEDGSISGTWDQVSNTRQLLDDMLPMMTSTADDRPAWEIGLCPHDPCRWKSDPFPFRKVVIKFMTKCLREEMERAMRHHTLFIGPDVDEKTVFVQCCGTDAEDAERQLNRFKNYYADIEDRLWVGEFPYCSMLKDARCCYFLGKKRYIVEDTEDNKTIVICERPNKEEIISIMHKLCALKHEDNIVERAPFSRSIPASNTDIWFTSTDITTLKAEAIACPNDEYLSCSSGLSEYIADLAGRDYRRKCEEATTDKKLSQFDVVVIRTEQYGMIFNVVMPHLRGPDRTELNEAIAKTSLSKIFESVLDLANRHGVSSLAMPALGADQKDVPNSWVAEAMVRAVRESISGGTTLRQIYIADEDVGALRLLLNEMTTCTELVAGDGTLRKAEVGSTSSGLGQRMTSPTPVTTSDEEASLAVAGIPQTAMTRHEEAIPEDDDDDAAKRTETAADASTPSDDEEVSLPQSVPHIIRMSRNQLLVHFHRCDITRLHVGAIVNVTNETLDYGGGIAKQICDAAGHRVIKDTHDRVKNYGPIPLTRTVVTSGGLLPCKCIIHAIGEPGSVAFSEATSLDQLRITLRGIIETAETCDIGSLAMSIDTAGMFGVPKSVGVRILYEELRDAEVDQLNTVHIVDVGEMTLSLAVDIFLQLEREAPSGEVTEARPTDQTRDEVQVFICSTVITELKADAIVCSNDEKLSCNTGLSEHISQLAGDRYQMRCNDAVEDITLAPATAIPVDSPTLGTIINVVIPRVNKPLEQMEPARRMSFMQMLQNGFQNAIDQAARLKLSSLAISPLGADQKNIPKLWIARALSDVILANIHRTTDFKEFLIADEGGAIIADICCTMRQNGIPYITGTDGRRECEGTTNILDQLPEEMDSPIAFHGPRGFLTENNIQVLIYKFDVTKLAVDVVVYIASEPLDDNAGTSYMEAKKRIRILGPLQVVSPAEGLQCKNVLLVVCPTGTSEYSDEYRQHCLKLLRDTAEDLLRTVDLYGFETFAMNCFTSGIIKVPTAHIMNALCHLVVDARTEHLKEMHFVGSSDMALSLLTNAFLRLNVTELSEDTISAIIRSRTAGRLHETLTIHGVKIYIYRADITQLDVEATVCETDAILSCSGGRAQNIVCAAGTKYQIRIRRARKSRHFQPTDVFSVQTDTLGLVINAVVPYFMTPLENPMEARADFKELLYRTYLNVFNEGKTYRIPRIATHPLGIEKTRFRSSVAQALCDALVDGLVPYEQLKEIHIVDTDGEFLAALRRKLRKRIVTSVLERKFRARPEWRPTRAIPSGFLTTNVISVFVHENDITKLTVGAVVCFTNENLSSISGISSHIQFVAGPDVQKERNKIVEKGGPVFLSGTVATSAGRLACRKIIHVVVPVWGEESYTTKKGQYLQLIRTTFSNIIQNADRNGLKSLAIPTAALGSFGVETEETAKLLCEVLTTACGHKVNEMHLVDTTGQSFSSIFDALTKINEEIREDELLNVVELDHDTVVSEIEKRIVKAPQKVLSHWKPTRAIPSGFITTNMTRIFIHGNGFNNLQVDAAACFANNKLGSIGEVTKRIYTFAGPLMYKEKKKVIMKRGAISACETVVTDAGMLACGSIIHAVVPVWTVERYLANEHQCLELVQKTFLNILQRADESGFKSLAIPTATLASFGIEKRVAARILCAVLATKGGSNLNEIHLVDTTGQSFSFIFDALTEINRVIREDGMLNLVELDPDTVVSEIDKRLLKLLLTSWRPEPVVPCGYMASETLLVFIHNTAITKLHVDVIVCSADDDVVIASPITKPIYNSAGSELKAIKEKTIRRAGDIADGRSIITTAPQKFRSRKVIHVRLCRKTNRSYHDTFRMFSNVIRTADRHGCRSLAMPAISSAFFGEIKPGAIRILLDVLMTARTKTLDEVHLVGVTDESLLYARKVFDDRVLRTRLGERLRIVELDQRTVTSTIARRRSRKQSVYELENGVKVIFHHRAGKGKSADANTKDVGFTINILMPPLTTAFWAYERFNDYEESLLATCQNAIDKANVYGLCTVAIHPIGLDERIIPNTWLVDKMCDALIDSINVSVEIREIHIFDENNGIVMFKWIGSDNLICHVKIDNRIKQQKAAEMKLIDGINSFVDLSVGAELLIHSRVKVLIYRSDVTKLKADATVFSNDENLSSSYGVAKRIADVAGESYKSKCRHAAEISKLEPPDAVGISTEKFGVLINAIMPTVASLFDTNSGGADDDYTQLLYAAFKRSFEEAIKHGVRYLIVSPLCADDESVPKRWVVKTLVYALLNTLQTDNQLKEIHIVDQNLRLLRVLWNWLHVHK